MRMHGTRTIFFSKNAASLLRTRFCLFLFRRQLDGSPGNHEIGFTEMMDRLWQLFRRRDPSFDRFENKKVVLDRHVCINQFAFDVGVTFDN